eukprot:Amastigsp_a339831_316.p3 type:complete len:165 gc:universal Amastigsp_a339831_316:172-666(+)
MSAGRRTARMPCLRAPTLRFGSGTRHRARLCGCSLRTRAKPSMLRFAPTTGALSPAAQTAKRCFGTSRLVPWFGGFGDTLIGSTLWPCRAKARSRFQGLMTRRFVFGTSDRAARARCKPWASRATRLRACSLRAPSCSAAPSTGVSDTTLSARARCESITLRGL